MNDICTVIFNRSATRYGAMVWCSGNGHRGVMAGNGRPSVNFLMGVCD